VASSLTLTLEPGIRTRRGDRLEARSQHTVAFVSQMPQVRFAGTGVILPQNPVLSIPFEAVSVRSVRVTAFRVFEPNVGQFLQANKLDGANELDRVGRYLWRERCTSPPRAQQVEPLISTTDLFRNQAFPVLLIRRATKLPSQALPAPGSARGADDLRVRGKQLGLYQDYRRRCSRWTDRQRSLQGRLLPVRGGISVENFVSSNTIFWRRDLGKAPIMYRPRLRRPSGVGSVRTSESIVGSAVSDGRLAAVGRGEAAFSSPRRAAAISQTFGRCFPPRSHFDVGGEGDAGVKVIYGEKVSGAGH
jgi:hypothetical protein